MELEHRLEVTQQLHPPTEVLDRMDEFGKFFKKIERDYNPNQLNVISVLGEAGIGKTIIAGQLMVLLENSVSISKKISAAEIHNQDGVMVGVGKQHHLRYFSLDKFLVEAKDQTGRLGNLPSEVYSSGAENMAKKIMENKIDLAAHFPNLAATYVLGVPAVYESRGALVVNALNFDTHKLVAVIAGRLIKERAKIIRDALDRNLSGGNNKEEFLRALEFYNVKIDKDLTDDEFEKLRHTIASAESVDIHEKALNDRMIRSKEELRERGSPSFSEKDLVEDPDLRVEILKIYYHYLLGERWGIPEKRFVVTQNLPIEGETINLYQSRLEIFD